MKAVELRQMSLEELRKRLADETQNLAALRFLLSTSQLESPLKVRLVRRDIARLRTMIHEKEAAGAAAGPKGKETPA
ncbi:MAG: 50S ribosomal protein L29 [Bacteroidota bacterium]